MLKYYLEIPIPMGNSFYVFNTNCHDACTFQPTIKAPNVKCSREAICHTIFSSVSEKKLNYDNLQFAIENWGKFAFATAEEAETQGRKYVRENIEKMKAAGYTVLENGRIAPEVVNKRLKELKKEL